MKKWFLLGVVSIFLILVLSAPLSAGIMYTVEYVRGTQVSNLMRIDTDTLAMTMVGPLGVPFSFGDLAWDSTNSTLYMLDGRGDESAPPNKSLYTVNTTTGAATLVGTHGLTDLFAMAFDSSTGTMYAGQYITNQPLETLNLSTGAATAVGSGVGNFRIGAMAYDSVTNQLIGLEDSLVSATLVTIDRATGVATTLRSTGLVTDNSGMTYDPVLNRLWDIDFLGRLSFFDPAAGYAQVQVTTYTGEYDGLAYVTTAAVPEPSTLLLLGSGLIGLAGYGRRKFFKK